MHLLLRTAATHGACDSQGSVPPHHRDGETRAGGRGGCGLDRNLDLCPQETRNYVQLGRVYGGTGPPGASLPPQPPSQEGLRDSVHVHPG